jgi:hypothetical protein
MMNRACNASYSEDGDWVDKVSEDPISTNGLALWCTPVISIIREAQIEGWRFRLA